MFGMEEEEPIEFVNFPVSQLPEHRALDFMPATTWMMAPIMEVQVEKDVRKHNSFLVETRRCPPKPIRLPATFCYVNRADYSLLRNELHELLSSLVDYDFSFDDKACMWRGMMVKGSRFVEVAINCYWDKKLQDHLVSVRKIDGDAMEGGVQFLFGEIQRQLCDTVFLGAAEPVSEPQERCSFVSASTNSSSSSSSARLPPRLMKEAPRSLCPALSSGESDTKRCSREAVCGIRQMLCMAQSDLLGVPCEAAKMLCDFAFLHCEVFHHCEMMFAATLSALTTLLQADQPEDVQQFAMQAFAKLMEKPDFAVKLMTGADFGAALVRWAANPVDANTAYLTASTRRKAMEIMARMSHIDAHATRRLLQSHGGFSSRDQWMQHVAQLHSDRLHMLGKEISHCFDA